MATVQLTMENFAETVATNDIVLVDFWAEWCAPCRMFGPTFEKSSEKYPNIVHGKVNTEQEQELAASFGIMSIPTLMAFREQVLLYAQPGALPGEALESLISKILELDMDDVRRQIAEDEHAGSHRH